MEIEQVAVETLKPWSENYRDHPQAQLEELEASLEEYGWYKNVVASSDDVVIAGNGVFEAARRRGENTVPVKRMDFPSTDPRAKKLAVADNELMKRAVDDERQLASLLRELEDTQGLDGTGWDDVELQDLLADLQAEEMPDDFQEFDPDEMEFEHQCPRCGYEW